MFFRREMLAFRRRKVIFRKALRAELDIKKSGGELLTSLWQHKIRLTFRGKSAFTLLNSLTCNAALFLYRLLIQTPFLKTDDKKAGLVLQTAMRQFFS
jgi:hypothetical protein